MNSKADWHKRLGWPSGFPLVWLVAVGAALAMEVFIAGAGARGQGVFWEELRLDRGPAWLGTILVLLAPFLLRFTQNVPFGRIGKGLQARPWMLVVAGAALYGALMLGCARRAAYTPDEAGAILQARIFARGQVTARVAPELVESVVPLKVQDDLVLLSRRDGRYSPAYWPGYALLMTPFALVGAQWACNPVITALSLWLLIPLGRRLSGSEEGGVWAALFTLSSAQIALHAASYVAMPAHLLFDILFCLCFVRGTKRGAFAAGLVGGFAMVLHNPVAHFSFALPWIIWMALHRRAHLGPLLLGYALLLVPLGAGWSAHLGGFDRGHYPGDAGVRVAASGSRFAEVAARISYALRPPDALLLLARGGGLAKTVVWAAPGLAGLALLGWLQARRQRVENEDDEDRLRLTYLRLLGASLACNFGIYLFTRFDQGHGWGFRYLHQSWLTLPLLGAAFITSQNGAWKKIAALSCLLSLLVVLPLRANLLLETVLFAERSRPPAPPSSPSIAFVREDQKAPSALWIQNEPFLRDQHWNLRFLSREQNAALAQRYLQNARRVQSGDWGETWSGSAFLRPGSP